MKKMFLFLMLTFLSFQTFGQLSDGTYYIGNAGTKPGGGDPQYLTLAAAISALNTNGIGAPTTFYFTSNTSEADSLYLNIVSNAPTAVNTLTFKPYTGTTPVITMAKATMLQTVPNNSGFAIQGVSYVTIDGSNTNGGTSRDLTFVLNDSTNGKHAIRIYANSDNVTVKNVKIEYTGYTTNNADATGIYAQGTASTAIDNLTITNCLVGSSTPTSTPYYGIQIYAENGFSFTNPIISSNTVYGRIRGIRLFKPVATGSTLNVLNNTISVVDGGAAAYGIDINNLVSGTPQFTAGTVNIIGNKINSIKVNSAAAYGIWGSSISNGTFNINNNFIGGDFTASSTATGSSAPAVAGIHWGSSPVANISHNTIVINSANNNSTSNSLATGTACVSVLGSITLRNNILINEKANASGFDYAIRNANTTIDYNNLLVNGAAPVSNLGTNSKSVSVTFTSATDLHLSGGSIGNTNLIGATGTGITTDIDGETRSVTAPYMGADENISSPLPVELTSFTSTSNGNAITLNWATATEVDNYGFEVERSADNTTFTKVGFVAGAGNSNVQKQYSFVDENLVAGTYYYRLKQVDTDGSFEYSQVVSSSVSETPATFSLDQNYPNPFNPSTKISFALAKDSDVKLSVFNTLGEEVAVLINSTLTAGNHSVDFNATNLTSGMYLYKIQAGSFVAIRKMSLVK